MVDKAYWEAIAKRLAEATERGYHKDEDIKERLADAAKEKSLCLSGTYLLDEDLDDILETIADYHHLTEISCENNPITDVGLDKIFEYCKTHPNITYLSLNTLPLITDQSVIKLLDLENLERLDLWMCREITDEFAKAALKQNHLTNVDLRETKISGNLRLQLLSHANKLRQQKEFDEHVEPPTKCMIL